MTTNGAASTADQDGNQTNQNPTPAAQQQLIVSLERRVAALEAATFLTYKMLTSTLVIVSLRVTGLRYRAATVGQKYHNFGPPHAHLFRALLTTLSTIVVAADDQVGLTAKGTEATALRRALLSRDTICGMVSAMNWHQCHEATSSILH